MCLGLSLHVLIAAHEVYSEEILMQKFVIMISVGLATFRT